MAKRIPIRLDFEGQDAQKFQAVKDYRGVKANNELIRVLISDAYNEIPGLASPLRAKKITPKEVPA
jgi:hypothetical protein